MVLQDCYNGMVLLDYEFLHTIVYVTWMSCDDMTHYPRPQISYTNKLIRVDTVARPASNALNHKNLQETAH